MGKVSIQPYKGTRDFYPEDKRLQDYIFGVWRSACASFGYQEYDAPMIESLDLYRLKNQESSEIVNEQVYSFTDRGGREVAVRPEMTPSVSRMVAAKRQELAYPLRLFSIPNLWRYERPQKGRLREHWQLNVDIFGVEGMEAEHELVMIASQIMEGFGASRDMYEVRYGSRAFMEDLLDYLGVDETLVNDIFGYIDRYKKYKSADDAAKALKDILSTENIKNGLDQKLIQLLDTSDLKAYADVLQTKGYRDLLEFSQMVESSGLENVRFDASIVRGFAYYTGIVFEVFDTSPDNNRSLFGGGRYDGLVGALGADPVPTAGFGKGDVTIVDFLRTHDLLSDLPNPTDIYVVLAGDVYEQAQQLFMQLRIYGLKVAVDTSGRKISKQIDAAAKAGARHVLFVGEDELREDSYELLNLDTQQKQRVAPDAILDAVSS